MSPRFRTIALLFFCFAFLSVMPSTVYASDVYACLSTVTTPSSDYCSSGQPFNDVPADQWYCPWVKALKELGITTGYGSPLIYAPGNNTTRGEMAAYIVRALARGQIRVVGSPSECVTGETAVVLNAVGATSDPLTDAPLCFQADGAPNLVVKLVFKKMAQNHYLFTGEAWNAGKLWTMMTGSGLVVPSTNKLYLTSHEAGSGENPDNNFWSSQNLIVLDLDTFVFRYSQENSFTWNKGETVPDIHYKRDDTVISKMQACPTNIP